MDRKIRQTNQEGNRDLKWHIRPINLNTLSDYNRMKLEIEKEGNLRGPQICKI